MTFSAATWIQQVRQREQRGQLEQPVLGQRHRHDVPAARTTRSTFTLNGNYATCRGTRRWRRYTWAKTTSDVDLGQTVLNAVGVFTPLLPDTATFNGERSQSFTLAWTAMPVTNVDTRVFYNWTKLDNDSTLVTFCPTTCSSCGGNVTNEL